MSEYSILVLFEIFVNFIVIVSIIKNETFNKKKRRMFLISYMCVELNCFCDYLVIALSGTFFAKLIVFALQFYVFLAVPICFGYVFENEGRGILRYNDYLMQIPIEVGLLGCGLLLLMSCLNSGIAVVFTLSATVFFIMFAACWICFLIKAIYFLNFFEKKFREIFAVIVVSIILGALIQTLTMYIGIYSFILSIGTLVMYICYSISVNEHIDPQTQFLNQKFFKEKIYSKLRGPFKSFRVLLFYVDDETCVCIGSKDPVNKALAEAFECIQTIYSKYGSCYRVEAGKLAIIVESGTCLDDLNKRLINALEYQRKKQVKLPFIYYSVLTFDDSLNDRNIVNYACSEACKL